MERGYGACVGAGFTIIFSYLTTDVTKPAPADVYRQVYGFFYKPIDQAEKPPESKAKALTTNL
ncbi:MAG: hypothetical protein RIG66_07690 [Coleofasciculus sp. E2-BRE-01]